jgi:hypothetical protein
MIIRCYEKLYIKMLEMATVLKQSIGKKFVAVYCYIEKAQIYSKATFTNFQTFSPQKHGHLKSKIPAGKLHSNIFSHMINLFPILDFRSQRDKVITSLSKEEMPRKGDIRKARYKLLMQLLINHIWIHSLLSQLLINV